MAGGRLRCLSRLFTCGVVGLLGVCLHDVEASSGKGIIHKKVGDAVELSAHLPTEGVTLAQWKYKGLIVADKDGDDSEKHQFKGRVDLNPTNFSLTVRKLTLQDSGDFLFVSEVNDTQQRDTVTITLQVHKPITKQPVLNVVNITWDAFNQSCTVLLECSAPSGSTVTYNWAVGNQTRSGPRLRYVITPQEGETEFTCTVSNFVSEESSSVTKQCSNSTFTQETGTSNFIVALRVAGGCCLTIVIVVGVAVGVWHCKRRQAAGSDADDLTVYANISDVAVEDGTMKPCSVYETIDNRVISVTPGPQTVYDKIQLNRVRNASVSPYQEVS